VLRAVVCVLYWFLRRAVPPIPYWRVCRLCVCRYVNVSDRLVGPLDSNADGDTALGCAPPLEQGVDERTPLAPSGSQEPQKKASMKVGKRPRS
jgi:hypothetical protein